MLYASQISYIINVLIKHLHKNLKFKNNMYNELILIIIYINTKYYLKNYHIQL